MNDISGKHFNTELQMTAVLMGTEHMLRLWSFQIYFPEAVMQSNQLRGLRSTLAHGQIPCNMLWIQKY